MFKLKIVLIGIFLIVEPSFAQFKHLIVVAKDGSGDFTTVSDAVHSLPMFNYERIVIKIMNGIYYEKVRIEQDNITLRGENREKTIIKYNQLREDWNKNKDSIGPAVVNIFADDVILDNLTIENTQPEIGPHAFSVYGMGTRTIITNCNIISKGGDTVSLWDYKTGMYYHSNCYFEGAVDFVCPRGWCYIKDSEFYEVKKTASLWHAGGFDKDQKFVIVNSSFDGVEGFELGRHHYEAQFFLINCSFSKNMSPKPIYRVTYEDTTRNRPFNWGKRYYFYNSNQTGGNQEWIEDNLPDSESVKDITSYWTFDNMWNPESEEDVIPVGYEIQNKYLFFHFDEPITVYNQPVLKSSTGIEFKYLSGAGSDTIQFIASEDYNEEDLEHLKIINDAKLNGTIACIKERKVSFNLRLEH